MVWWIWVLIAIVLVVAEMLTLDLVLLMLAGGALAAALAAELGVENIIWQGIIWAVVSLLLLLFLRKWMLEHMKIRGKAIETNAQSSVGKTGVTVTDVNAAGGRIKFQGEVWSARSADGTELPNGTHVTVIKIDGATAIVEPILRPIADS